MAGAGGFANKPSLPHQIETTSKGKPFPRNFQTTHPDLKLAHFVDKEPGYLRVSVDRKAHTLTIEYFVVPFLGAPSGKAVDSVVTPW